jgi:hypothetical protein
MVSTTWIEITAISLSFLDGGNEQRGAGSLVHAKMQGRYGVPARQAPRQVTTPRFVLIAALLLLCPMHVLTVFEHGRP